MKQMNMTDKIYEAGHFAPKTVYGVIFPFDKKTKIVKMYVVNNTLYFIYVVKRNCMNNLPTDLYEFQVFTHSMTFLIFI